MDTVRYSAGTERERVWNVGPRLGTGGGGRRG